MVNVTELLSKYLKSLKPHSGPRWTMEALDLLSKCPGSSPPHRYWNPFQKDPFTAHTMRLSMRRWEKGMVDGPYSTNCESIYLQPILFKESFGAWPYWFVCLFIFLCVFHRSVFVPPLASWISRDVLLATRFWSEKSSKAAFVKDGRGRAPLGRWGR